MLLFGQALKDSWVVSCRQNHPPPTLPPTPLPPHCGACRPTPPRPAVLRGAAQHLRACALSHTLSQSLQPFFTLGPPTHTAHIMSHLDMLRQMGRQSQSPSPALGPSSPPPPSHRGAWRCAAQRPRHTTSCSTCARGFSHTFTHSLSHPHTCTRTHIDHCSILETAAAAAAAAAFCPTLTCPARWTGNSDPHPRPSAPALAPATSGRQPDRAA